MERTDGRLADQLRKIKITKNYLTHPMSSVLIEFGGTKVICAVCVDKGVPGWMRAQNVPGGWVTSEYSMLPGSTHQRSRRESRGSTSGRTMEIQRLVGRTMRSVVDLEAIGPNTVYIDCDVIDADGGTRCASITGASVALWMAFERMLKYKRVEKNPMRELVAAVSVGIHKGEPILDLCYEEDSSADVDMNVVMTESGKFVELQGTAEEAPFSRDEMNKMLDLADKGLKTIFEIQKKMFQPNNNNRPGKRHRNGEPLGSIGDLMGDVKL